MVRCRRVEWVVGGGTAEGAATARAAAAAAVIGGVKYADAVMLLSCDLCMRGWIENCSSQPTNWLSLGG